MPDYPALIAEVAADVMKAAEAAPREKWNAPPEDAKKFLPHVEKFYRVAQQSLAPSFVMSVDASESDVAVTITSNDHLFRALISVTMQDVNGQRCLFQNTILRKGSVRYPGRTILVEVKESTTGEGAALALVTGTLSGLRVALTEPTALRADCRWPSCQEGLCNGPCRKSFLG